MRRTCSLLLRVGSLNLRVGSQVSRSATSKNWLLAVLWIFPLRRCTRHHHNGMESAALEAERVPEPGCGRPFFWHLHRCCGMPRWTLGLCSVSGASADCQVTSSTEENGLRDPLNPRKTLDCVVNACGGGAFLHGSLFPPHSDYFIQSVIVCFVIIQQGFYCPGSDCPASGAERFEATRCEGRGGGSAHAVKDGRLFW